MTRHRRRPRKQERNEAWFRHIGEKNIEGPCSACDRTIHFSDFVVGHAVALAKGGQDTIANMRPLCHRCDQGMGTDSIDEYRQRLRGAATASPGAQEPELVAAGIVTTNPPPRRFLPFLEMIVEGDCYIEGASIDPSVPFHSGKSRRCQKCRNTHCENHSHTEEGQRFCVVCWEAGRPYREADEQLPEPLSPLKVEVKEARVVGEKESPGLIITVTVENTQSENAFVKGFEVKMIEPFRATLEPSDFREPQRQSVKKTLPLNIPAFGMSDAVAVVAHFDHNAATSGGRYTAQIAAIGRGGFRRRFTDIKGEFPLYRE